MNCGLFFGRLVDFLRILIGEINRSLAPLTARSASVQRGFARRHGLTMFDTPGLARHLGPAFTEYLSAPPQPRCGVAQIG